MGKTRECGARKGALITREVIKWRGIADLDLSQPRLYIRYIPLDDEDEVQVQMTSTRMTLCDEFHTLISNAEPVKRGVSSIDGAVQPSPCFRG